MTLRRTCITLVVLLAATLVAAQEPDASPRFFIDAIAVDGVRYASERVIVAETRLVAGREYTEAEIRAGAARAMRLPFVVRIEPRIEKGAQRGAYRLVLAVTETRPLFFGGTYIVETDDDRDQRLFTTGARRFLGRSGMLHGAASSNGDDPFYELGYTQYDLFGSGVFVATTVEYGADVAHNPPGDVVRSTFAERLTAQVVAGVPLRGNHALRATFLTVPVAVSAEVPLEQQKPGESLKYERARTVELSWIHDSTDDPLFPTSGTRGVATAGRADIPLVVPLAPQPLRSNHRHLWLSGDLRRVWNVAPRHTVTGRGGYTYLHRIFSPSGGDFRENIATGGATYSYSVFGPDRPSRLGDLRLEAGLVSELVRFHDEFYADGQWTMQAAARFGLLFRNEWGVVRLRFDVGQDRE